MEPKLGNAAIASAVESAGARSTRLKKVMSSLWHLAQMVLAMEAGMGVYHALLGTTLDGTSYAALNREYPVFGYWMMFVAMSIPMIVLMRYLHKSTWLYCMEMTAAMAVPGAFLTVLIQTGPLPTGLIQGNGGCGVGHPLMILAMAGFMLVRPMHKYGVSGRSKPNCH